MKKTIIICGTVAGLIVTIWMLLVMSNCIKNPNFQGSMLLGYTSMLVAFSLIFVGIKNSRDKYYGGVISFGKAFRIGFMIALIASTMYVVVWLIDYYYFIPDYFSKYSAHIVAKMKAAGASAAEVQKQIADNERLGKLYKDPIFCALFTYLEILPLGLIVTIIAALVLKRKTAAGQLVPAS